MVMRPVLVRVLIAALCFAALEAAAFHSGLYERILEPDSTTGAMETRLRIERERKITGNRNAQVLVVGDSRLDGFRARVANELTGETGYTFGSVALGGTSPRCWYYNIRTVDPDRNRYAAVIVPSNDYDERDRYDDWRNREADLHYLGVRLGMRDLLDFPLSYGKVQLQRRAFLGILFKGYVYKRDFIEYLQDPDKRMERVKLYREGAADWLYSYEGSDENMVGIDIDWTRNVAHYPDSMPLEKRKQFDIELFQATPPDRGIFTAYFRLWFGRIVDYYRGTRTKVIFLRFPRGAVPQPAKYPPKPDSAVRELAATRPNAVLIDEHRFDELERPEFFANPLHLNRPGMERLSRMLAREVRKILGPPPPSGE